MSVTSHIITMMAIIILIYTAIPLALIYNRLYIRVFRSAGWACLYKYKAWPPSDVLVILAWLTTMPRLTLWCYRAYVAGLGPDSLSTANRETMVKIEYITTLSYWFPMYFAKGALLFFYAEIVPPMLSKMWWAIRITGVVTFGGGLATLFLYLFWCIPNDHNLSFDHEVVIITTMKCDVLHPLGNYLTLEILHIGTDLIVFIMPFFLLPRLKFLPRNKKISVAAMFALGFISVGCAILGAYLNSYSLEGVNEYGNNRQDMWKYLAFTYGRIVEQSTAICVVCLPALRKSIRRLLKRWRGDKRHSQTDSEDGGVVRVNVEIDLEVIETIYSYNKELEELKAEKGLGALSDSPSGFFYGLGGTRGFLDGPMEADEDPRKHRRTLVSSWKQQSMIGRP